MESIPIEEEGRFEVHVREDRIGRIVALECERGDYIEVANLQGIIFNRPGYVAAFGRIPEELKIDGGISFLLPCPPFKYPKNLSGDSLKSYNVCLMHGFRQTFDFNMRCGLIWNKEWDYGEDIYERPTVLRVEVNMTPSLGIWKGLGSWNPLPSIGSSFRRYSIRGYDVNDVLVFQSPTSGHELLAVVSSDAALQVVPNMGLIKKEPEIVAAVGGIPDEHKIIGGISFSIPTPFFLFPTRLIEDPMKRHEADSFNGKSKYLCRIQFMQAYKKAEPVRVGVSSIPPITEYTSPTCIADFTEVNVRKGQVSGVSEEDGIQQLFNSFWSFFSHSILQPLEEKTTTQVVQSGGTEHNEAVIEEDSMEDYAKQYEAAFGDSSKIGPILGPKERKEVLEYYAYKNLVVREVNQKPLIRIEDSVPCDAFVLDPEDFLSPRESPAAAVQV